MSKAYFRRIFLLLLLLPALRTPAQQSAYYIRNYLPKEYGGFNQTWQAIQDKNGRMYFASTSNVFIYDGTRFDKVPVKSGSACRQIAIDSSSGIIYVGAVNEFGYLQRDSLTGQMVFHSMLGTLTEKQKEFSDVWKVCVLNGRIYFQSSERIFICEGKKVVDVIEGEKDKTFALMFSCNNRVFVRQRNVGLMEIKGNSLSPLPGGDRFATVRLLGMMPWKPGEDLVLSGDSGFFVMQEKNTNAQSLFTPLGKKDSLLASGSVLGCKWVNDSTFAVNSRMGLAFYNRDANLLEMINKNSGLTDESIAEIFLDRQKNIWLLHNNGFSKICYNSPVHFFDDKSGFEGTIEMMMSYQGSLYLASSEGVFVKTPQSDEAGNLRFQVDASFPRTEVWDMQEINGDLYVATTNGMFVRHEGKTSKFSERCSNRVCASEVPNEIVVTEKGGFSVFSTVTSPPQLLQHFDLPAEDLIQTGRAETVPGKPALRDMWTATRFKTMMHIRFSVTENFVQTQEYDTANGLPLDQVYPVRISDSTYFLSTQMACRYVPSKDKGPKSLCFLPAPDIFERMYSNKEKKMFLPFDFRLFLQSTKNSDCAVFGRKGENTLSSTSLPLAYFQGDLEVQYVYNEVNGITWIISNDGIIRYDASKKILSDVPYNCVIGRVLVGKDSAIFYGSDQPDYVRTEAIPYKFNSISFRFSAPFFDYDRSIQYFYRLDDFDTTWYRANQLLEKNYTNLREGTYTFRVKAINQLGHESRESSYTFTILAPWYRSSWAYVLYVIGFIGSIFLSVRLGLRRLRRQKEKLEIIVSERTNEVVQQKHLLEEAFTNIRASIQYAKRIQEAILPVKQEMQKELPDSFVYFVPRDIVSGDFYWFARKENKSIIACVDCTGHGVPGAFMSMIGNTLLNEIVLEKNITAPEQVLSLLHQRVRQALHQDTGGETRDGMDIALVVLDAAKKELRYAGANRPLWIVREEKLLETKPNKRSIAGDEEESGRKFTLHTFTLQNGDCVYLSSDGYADQFGGEKGKKFMVKRFQQLLLEIHKLPMAEQGMLLEQAFLGWKGELEQVDDVLVIGFRF